MNNSIMTRKFERLLFKGVPEQPEPIWERDDNMYVSMRKSGKSQCASIDTISKGEAIGKFKFDFETGAVNYERDSDALKSI